MAVLPATAPGPVSFTEPSSGQFVCLPLSSLSFDNGAIKGSGALFTTHKTAAEATLGHLVSIGYLKPGPPPVLKPALVVKAATAGTPGNGIQVEFFDFDYATPANPTFKVRATQVVVYSGITSGTVQAALGSGAGSGPVFVPGAAPAEGIIPKASEYSLVVTAPATSAAADIAKEPTGVAFSVQARAAGAEGANTKVQITNVDSVTGKFTLTARWEKSTPARIAASAVDAAFAYLIDIEPPEGAAAIAPPAPGLVTLSGGAEAATANKASAVAAG